MARAKQRTKGSSTRRRRWWVLPLALGIAVAAGLLLLRGSPFGGADDPPLDHIDDASRKQLEQVLRDAEDVPVERGRGR